MEIELVKAALTQGIWASLAMVLIFYILRAQEKRDLKQEEREEKYQSVIAQLSSHLSIVADVKEEVKEVKNYIMTQKK